MDSRRSGLPFRSIGLILLLLFAVSPLVAHAGKLPPSVANPPIGGDRVVGPPVGGGGGDGGDPDDYANLLGGPVAPIVPVAGPTPVSPYQPVPFFGWFRAGMWHVFFFWLGFGR